LKSYIVSLRNIDLILIIDSNLKSSTEHFYVPGARQHFARVLSASKITALGNFTNGANSKLLTWDKIDTTWKESETDLPIKIPYCGNINVLPDNLIWVAGGCVDFEKDTAGVLYSNLGKPVTELGRLKLLKSSGSYRVDLYTP
jgi:hypothetical protein